MHRLIPVLLILLAAIAGACVGDDEEATPAATEEATDEATATEAADGAGDTFSSTQLPVSVTVTAPPAWEQPSEADLPDLFAVFKQGIGWVDFLQPTQFYVYASETQSEVTGPPADYVAWFNENPFATVVATEDVTVGGLQGTRLEMTNPNNEPFALFKLSDGSDYDLSYLDHIYAYVLDANGTQIIVSCGVERGGPEFTEFAQTCEEILGTVEFGTS
jgi:hypothetical protein